MKISATSALVLNWTEKNNWRSKEAKEYNESLDLDEGASILRLFSDKENYMHTQSVSNRKFFMRKCAVEFLEKNKSGQVVILAAGIAPLSIELAALFPEAKIFDVDKYLMIDKREDVEKLFKGSLQNIKFLECDITEISSMEKLLSNNGWNKAEPTLLIMEGITYYLRTEDLEKILKYFAAFNSALACDFLLNYELIHETNRIYGIEVFRKIRETVGLEFVNSYSPDEFMKLVISSDFKNPERQTMQDMQTERTGKPEPYQMPESGWITLVKSGI